MSTNATPQTAASPSAPDKSQPGGEALNLFPQAKGESDRAFEALRAYLELGPRRRYVAVGRKVGASLRTVKRWAVDFDWRGRIKTHAARCAEHYTQTETARQREELLDATARARAFRDRQYDLADSILAAAERYLERVDEDDLDQMNLADACMELAVASRLGRQAADRENSDPSAPARSLRDQLAALLDQAYGEIPPGNGKSAASQTQTNATPTSASPS